MKEYNIFQIKLSRVKSVCFKPGTRICTVVVEMWDVCTLVKYEMYLNTPVSVTQWELTRWKNPPKFLTQWKNALPIPYTVGKCPENSLHSGKISRKLLHTVEKRQEYPYTVSFRAPLCHWDRGVLIIFFLDNITCHCQIFIIGYHQYNPFVAYMQLCYYTNVHLIS